MNVLKVLLVVTILSLPVLGQEIRTSTLTGTIYDTNGAVIVGAKITATSAKGKKFQAVTNAEGVYLMVLPFYRNPEFTDAKYDLIVTGDGFKPSEIKGYVFIPSQFGKMTLDFGLLISCDTCYQIQFDSSRVSKKPR